MNHNDVTYLFPTLWIENNIKIINPAYGLIRFKLYDYQKKYIETVEENRFTIANKFRHSGLSTIHVAYALWDAIWHPDKNIVFLTNYDRCACHLSYIAKKMIEQLPEQPLLGTIKPIKMNDHNISFDNNSEINFWKCGAAKTKSIKHLFIEDAAFIDNMDNHWTAIYPVISSGGKCTISSTPTTKDKWFKTVYSRAIEKSNYFFPIKLNWRHHPVFNKIQWETKMTEALGQKGFLLEYEGEFCD